VILVRIGQNGAAAVNRAAAGLSGGYFLFLHWIFYVGARSLLYYMGESAAHTNGPEFT
jgi:hypothetical protein